MVKKGVILSLLMLAFVLPAHARVKPKVAKGQVKKEIAIYETENLKNSFQFTYGMGPVILSPAGFNAIDIYPEVYLPVNGLSVGLNFAFVPVAEGGGWGIAVDFVNVKYTFIPKKLSKLQPYLRTGWGMLASGDYDGNSDVTFDWVFGSGVNFWITENIGLGNDLTTHLSREGNWFTWLFSFRYKLSFE